jgi:flagellar hook-associated protein 3 FlgL
MRLTNAMMANNYLRNLNRNTKELNDLNTKVSAQRKFLKMSEDPASALAAFGVRKQLNRIGMYDATLKDSQGLLDEAEIALSSINETATSALTQVMQGITGTSDEKARKVIAEALRSYQESIIGAANAKFSDKYVFGGEGFEKMPFTVDGSGDLNYHGVNVDTGTFSEEHRYVDIGLGLSISGSVVSPQSAMDTAYSGADLLGSGVDGNGISNNLYQLLGQIADKLDSGNLTDMDLYIKKLESRSDDIRMQYVGIGEKANYITYFADRLDREKIAAADKQNKLESLSLEEGIMQFSEQELVYNACLQMGTKILQPSLLDYLS